MRRRLSVSSQSAPIGPLGSIQTMVRSVVDSRNPDRLDRRGSRLALSSDPQLAHRLGIRRWPLAQRVSKPMAGIKRSSARHAAGIGRTAAFRSHPQPWCRGLEIGRRPGSLPRPAAVVVGLARHHSRSWDHGSGRGYRQGTPQTYAPEYRAPLGGVVQPANARARSFAGRPAFDEDPLRRRHGPSGPFLRSRASAGNL